MPEVIMNGPEGRLEGRYQHGEGNTAPIALMLHPHPQHGGTMNNKVIYAPDPVHGGNPVPGLMGKLWVFGPDESVPLSLDGEIFVGAWDNSRTAQGGEPVLRGLSLAIEPDDLEEVPFNTIGGLGRAHELFGDNLGSILEELNTRLAA